MRGRVCLVTGATRGIGRATALGLARLGGSVVIMARDEERGVAARDALRRESGNAEVWLLVCDLASFASIRAAASALAERHPALHVLVNNAGVSPVKRRASADGRLDLTLAVNHLAPFLLTNLLLPLLRAGAPSRVVTVTSEFERLGRIDLDDLDGTNGGRLWVAKPGRRGALRAYYQSKLANVMFTYELAERLRGSGVTANCVYPGLVATDLLRDYPWWSARWLAPLWRKIFLSPEQGARASVHAASAPELEGVTGRCFKGTRPVRTSGRSYDRVVQAALWRASAAVTGLAEEDDSPSQRVPA